MESEKTVHQYPDLVWKRIAHFLGPQGTYTLSVKLPEVMGVYSINKEVKNFRDKNPFSCRKCTNCFPCMPLLQAHMDLAHPVPIEEQLRLFFSLGPVRK